MDPSFEATAADITADILLETRSVLFSPNQPFTLTSGRKSPVYIDCRRLISFPRARGKLMDLAAEMIQRHVGYESLEAVAGGETAGIPFAAWIAERLALPMLYIRKQAKGFGRMAQIEGVMQEGDRVLLVEDLISEGTSKLNFIRGIRAGGGTITHNFCVFHYGIFPSSVETLRDEGVALHALATWHAVLDRAHRLGSFPDEDYAAIRSFLDAPDDWTPPAG
jgi:orotate phosphoribosyltransferase